VNEAVPKDSPSERLLAIFEGHRLSPVQRRIAQYLLDHLPESAFLSSVELAERAGVSQPSVTRFAVVLGYAGYPELRNALRPIALGLVGRDGGARRNELQVAVESDLAHLDALRVSLAQPDQVLRVGRELAGSRPLGVLGLRVSAALAEAFGYFAQRIHPDVRVITRGGTSHDELLQVQQAGGSWVVMFLMPRYPVEAVEALRYARRIGLRSAVVTDRALVSFADDADALLTAGVGERLVFDSHAAPLALVMVLLQAMADADPQRTQARLDAYERMAEQEGLFVDL
jgi:DNA-binding MurR/RpiR family transcriptional regulator